MDSKPWTHNGVQAEFGRLTKDHPRVDTELRRFLSQSYSLKDAADYGVGPTSQISPDRAMRAVATAHRFVDHIVWLLRPIGPETA